MCGVFFPISFCEPYKLFLKCFRLVKNLLYNLVCRVELVIWTYTVSGLNCDRDTACIERCLYMCLYMLPQGVRAERKVFASACCIDTDSPAYLCTSPVLEQAIYKQTKPPKRNTPSLRAHKCQRLRTHAQTHTHAHACHLHRGPCGVSFKCISLSETHGSKRFCFPQQKIRGDNFTVVVLSLTLSLSFQPALSSPPLPVRIYSIYLWKAGSRERCISRNEVRDQI